MPRAPKPPKPSSEQLAAVLGDFNRYHRHDAFYDYSCHTPDIADLSTLRRALQDSEYPVVRSAAVSIGKLGPAAREVARDLFVAARRAETALDVPQSYCECLDALIAIGADPDSIVELVFSNFGHTNWGYVRSSMHALHRLATPKALDLLGRAVTFWWPDLNKRERAYVQKHFAEWTKGAA